MSTTSPGSPGGRGKASIEPPVVPDHSLLRLIGRGSYGEVWLARNVMGTYRAVKAVYRTSFDNEGPYEREFAGIRKFEPVSRSHESQVDILHIGRNDEQGYFYYVMELADDASPMRSAECGVRNDEPLSAKHPELGVNPETYVPRTLQHDLDTRERMPLAECLEISSVLAGALRHLHERGLVHRDVKPSNIIFVNGIPKLADIGLVTESEATITYVGAQGFMAPEGPGRPRGDIYSLGKVIYELCTGRDRLDFPALPANFGEWPDRRDRLELLTVSLKACEPDPNRRYGSAAEMGADLVLLQAGKSVRRLRWLERNWRWALGVAGAAALAALAGWLAQIETHAREHARQREVLVREGQMLRLSQRQTDWSSNALQRFAEAGRLRLDSELRNQAAAALEGLDARVLLLGHRPAAHIAFDRQSERVLLSGWIDRPAEVWDLQSGATNALAVAGRGPVWFASDGSPRQLIEKAEGGMQMVAAQDGRILQELRMPAVEVGERFRANLVEVSENGGVAAATMTNRSGENATVVWNVLTGEVFAHSTNTNSALALAPDGGCLATGDEEGRVRVLTLPGLSEVAAFHQDRAIIRCLAFQRDPSAAGDGRWPWLLAAGDSGGKVTVYQTASGRVKSICRGSFYDILSVALSADGMTVAAGGNGDLRIWDVGTGRNLLNAGWRMATRLAFSPDGSKLGFVIPNYSGMAWSGVLELEGHRGVTALRGLSSQSTHAEFSHDGQRLAALSQNWELGLWNLASNRLEWVLEAPKGLYADNAALRFSRDESQLACATLAETRLWDLKSGELRQSWLLPRGLVQQLSFDPAGRLLHFQWDWPEERSGRCCRVRELLRNGEHRILSEFPEFHEQVFDAVLARSGDFLVIVGAGADGTNIVKAYDPVNGRELCHLPASGNWRNDYLATDPKTSRIAYWLPRTSETVCFDMPSGHGRGSFPGDGVYALAPDGLRFAVTAHDGRGCEVVMASQSSRRLTLGIDEAATIWPQFSPDGKLLAWGTADGTVLVADLDEVMRRLEGLGLGWK